MFHFHHADNHRNVKLHTTLPASSIISTAVQKHATFLDTVGRTSVVIRARNLVDEFRDREVVVAYEVALTARLRKPLVVFASAVLLFFGWAIVSRVEVKFSRKR